MWSLLVTVVVVVVVVENLYNSQENTLVRVSFLIKLQVSVCNFIKKKTLAQVFSCEFCEISKNTFFTKHLWLLLYWNLTDYILSERLKNTFKASAVFVLVQ